MASADVILVMLRRPHTDPDEMRSDPFWEFGSFGCTGCHHKNLMNPHRSEELSGKRLAFAQGGNGEVRLVYVTPPIKVVLHEKQIVEARWNNHGMPLKFECAPVIISNNKCTVCPSIWADLDDVARKTPVARFASKFRSRRMPTANALAAELIAAYEAAQAKPHASATTYEQALPNLPPKVDRNRKFTYERCLRDAMGNEFPICRKRKC